MIDDPRSKNKTFSAESPMTYLREYAAAVESTLLKVKPESLEAAVKILEGAIRSGRRVYVCGNGGSAAIADHLCCDWTKGSQVDGLPPLKTHSLVANSSLMTALANDYGYDETFSAQVKYFGEADDVLVAISSSGNSANIVKAVEAARARRLKIIGISGFSGGKLLALSDVSIHTAFDNYGIVEDCHQSIMHVLSQYLVKRLETK